MQAPEINEYLKVDIDLAVQEPREASDQHSPCIVNQRAGRVDVQLLKTKGPKVPPVQFGIRFRANTKFNSCGEQQYQDSTIECLAMGSAFELLSSFSMSRSFS